MNHTREDNIDAVPSARKSRALMRSKCAPHSTGTQRSCPSPHLKLKAVPEQGDGQVAALHVGVKDRERLELLHVRRNNSEPAVRSTRLMRLD